MAIAGFGVSSARAATVLYSNDFSTAATGFNPTTNTGVTIGIDSTGPGGSSAYHFSDTDSSNFGSSSLGFGSFGAFSTATAGQNTFQVSADFAVASLFNDAAGAIATPRFQLTLTGSTQISVGFGQDSSGKLDLYVGTGNAPTPGVATTLATLGTYDSTTAANNNTGGYVNLLFTYTNQQSLITVTASSGSTVLGTTTVPITATTVTNSGGTVGITTGSATTSSFYVDNLQVSLVPEPATSGMFALSACWLLGRGRFGRRNRRLTRP